MIICTFADPMCRLRLMRGRCLLLVLLPLILLVACDDGAWQRLQLEELERMNRADSLMTNDSLALDLADWFDRHGTPNEQMRAYYILGRTYADLGEAPQAIEAYNDAADRADTTDADCDYKTLCRVYTQMADVYYHQDLYHYQLSNLDRAVYYGYLANDTLAALLAYAQKMDGYDMLMMPDSMLSVCETVSRKFREHGFLEESASVLAIPITHLSENGELEKAALYMKRYERESGFFDDDNNIESGREIYYYDKGRYFLKVCQFDSAEYYFRKELATGKDFNNQNAGALGLALLYQQTDRPDSAAKYALYSYAMNDSAYSHKSTTDVAQMKSLYDYRRYEQQAQQEKDRADRERAKTITVFVLATIVFSIVVVIIWIQRKRHRATYRKAIRKLSEAQNTILQLRSHEAILRSAIEKYAEEHVEAEELKSEMAILRMSILNREEEIERQKAIVADFQQKEQQTKKSVEQLINESNTYKHLRTIANQGRRLTDEDWNQLMQLVITLLPGFYNLISSKERKLSQLEYQICILDRLDIEPSRMQHLLGISESYVSRIRGGLHKKIFGSDATGKEFSRVISTIV